MIGGGGAIVSCRMERIWRTGKGDEKTMAEKKTKTRNNVQLIWGIALIMAGVGVFVRIPQVMPKLAQIEYFSSALWLVRFCFYLMGIILFGGGIKKIISYFR
jgi:hypothetical protein